MSTTEAIEPEYESELQRAEEANLEGIEGLGICKLVTDKDGSLVPDKDGNALIIVTPSLVPKTGDSWERSFQLYLRETKEICHVPYRLIFVYSAFYPPLWFPWWLMNLKKRVSRNHRKNLNALTIVHPSVALRCALLSLSPIIGNQMWEKIHYVDRVEELWIDEIMSEDTCMINISRGVFAYEGILIDQSEEARILAISHGAPLGRRDGPQ